MIDNRDNKTDIWSWFIRNGLALGDYLIGQRMTQRLKFLEEAQWWDKERIYTTRDRYLYNLIAVAYNEVPFYQQLMDKAKVKPEDIRCAADLNKLPIITKDMIRPCYPHLITRNTGQKTYESKTSGSTGKNFLVLEDNTTAGWYRATILLALEWAGWVIGQRHVQTGMTVKRGFQRTLKDLFLHCHYFSVMETNDAALDRILGVMEKHKIRHLWGYPGSLYLIACRALKLGWNTPLNSIATWGDSLYPYYRQTIENVFKRRVFDTYGCAEGMQISAQCGHEQNYHIHNFDVIVEYVDDCGQPVSAETSGNIIITRLHPGPMPLIRYRIGDVGIRGNQDKCPCGRGLEQMQSIQGREMDIIITPSGNRLIVHFFTGILEHFNQIDSFQIIQENIDSICINIVPRENFTKEVAVKVARTLQQKGADIRIDINLVKEIPPTPAGKRKFVISKLNQTNCGFMDKN